MEDLRKENEELKEIIRKLKPMVKSKIDDNGRPGYYSEDMAELYKRIKDI